MKGSCPIPQISQLLLLSYQLHATLFIVIPLILVEFLTYHQTVLRQCDYLFQKSHLEDQLGIAPLATNCFSSGLSSKKPEAKHSELNID